MVLEIRVPQLGESIVEATVGKWAKQPGDRVAAGEALVELETDKINIEVPAEADGVLSSLLRREGETVSVGDVIATIEEGAVAAGAATPSAVSVADAPAAASPVARKLAEEKGLDLGQVKGSGPNGRITKDDVASHIEKSPAPAQHIPTAAAPAVGKPVLAPTPAPVSAGRLEERIPMSRRRQTIAHRLVEAQHTAAMLTTFNEVDMTAIMEIRKRRKDSFKERHGVGLGFMSFFTRASVGALKAFPLVNGEIQNDEIVLKKYYDIGVAVSTEQGLVVPVVRDADRKTFAQIEKDIVDLATRARENKLGLPDLTGGTFTITNGGIFGSLMSTPIINAPQVAILGMHKIQERPIALNGEVVIRPMMYVALSYDHRIIDGSEAVRFLVRVKELLEDPESLLLDA
ncbi:MAG: 2-oxoglutarate dehydrogenase complex dihydrolipoyllysine-residue succinyltransferase [Capsulimonadaceae bacterium]|nr:2-oxoglutarate dehydrogenase complex dihydrolipoyllysine-residue succinyltransferase [Capsulimonadaceae bacterium]